uniref:Translocation protein SEC62 n=1 Tax=Aceria tosichella TaxID=561515 RepID=A0A6G1SM75_9ACAR
MVSKKNQTAANDNNNNNHQCNSNHNHNQKSDRKQKHTEVELEITSQDYAIAKYMRNNLPNKEAMFLGIKRVNYFIGSKAIDLLMESKWATQEEPIFKTRNDVRIYLNDLLIKKFYHRARKIVKMDGAKKKFKLDMHDEQCFQDSNQPYVWLYEPTSIKAWLLCFGVIFGVIAVCLFPLWPPIIRTWVYYLCIAGLVFLTSILGLAVMRHIVFMFLWTLTFGKLHFWILPNLTEDVGFLESFWPLYAIDETCGAGSNEITAGATDSGDNGGAGGSGEGVSADQGGRTTAHDHQD